MLKYSVKQILIFAFLMLLICCYVPRTKITLLEKEQLHDTLKRAPEADGKIANINNTMSYRQKNGEDLTEKIWGEHWYRDEDKKYYFNGRTGGNFVVMARILKDHGFSRAIDRYDCKRTFCIIESSMLRLAVT